MIEHSWGHRATLVEMAQRGAPLPRLKALRLRAGLTQAGLAELCATHDKKVGQNTINRLERTGLPAEARTAQALAKALGVTVADLMGPAE